MCWVMPPASPATTLRGPDRVEQLGLAVVDVAHDGDDRRPRHQVLVLAGVLAVFEVERLQQLAVLVLGRDDLNVVVQLAAEQAQRVVVDRLGRRDQLAELEQHGDQVRRAGVDAIREVGQGGAAGQPHRPRRCPARCALHRSSGACMLSNSWRFGALRLAAAAGATAGLAERAGRVAASLPAGTAATGGPPGPVVPPGRARRTARTAGPNAAGRLRRRAAGRRNRRRAGTRTRGGAPGRAPGPPGPRRRDPGTAAPGPPGPRAPGPPGRPGAAGSRRPGHHAGIGPRGAGHSALPAAEASCPGVASRMPEPPVKGLLPGRGAREPPATPAKRTGCCPGGGLAGDAAAGRRAAGPGAGALRAGARCVRRGRLCRWSGGALATGGRRAARAGMGPAGGRRRWGPGRRWQPPRPGPTGGGRSRRRDGRGAGAARPAWRGPRPEVGVGAAGPRAALGPRGRGLPPAPILVRNLRTTGPSTVEEGDLTYSPISASSLTTSLLSSPNSLASS